MRALKLYAEERDCATKKLSDFSLPCQLSPPVEEASALPEPSSSAVELETDINIPQGIIETECVICMETAVSTVSSHSLRKKG